MRATQGAIKFCELLSSIAAPIKRGSVTEWATSGGVELPETVSQNDGKYSTSSCKYMEEVLEDFRDVTMSHSSLCFAAQVFKTTGMMVGVGYKISQAPANVMWVMPNKELLKSTVETKWFPVVEASPDIRKHKPTNPRKFKLLQQQFDRMDLFFVASGSEKNLKGRSVEIIILDEIDDIEEEWNKKGKSAVRMAESRTKSFTGSKVFKTSTPTTITGAIWVAFIDGDQRLFFVSCPHCQKEMTLEFSPEYTRQYFPDVPAARVVWGKDAGFPDAKHKDGEWDLKKVAETARLKCPHCEKLITESEKIKSVRKGYWKATNLRSEAGVRSRRLPSIYSPHPKTSIAALAVKYLKCFGKPGALRNFMNEELALPWQEKGSSVSKSDIRHLADFSPEYLIGQIPKDNVSMLALTVDVQQDCFWFVVRAWFGDGSSALIDYGQAVAWSELMEQANKEYVLKSDPSKKFQSMFCLIDSGYRAKRSGGVYDFCLGMGAGRFYPTKGRGEWAKTVAETDIDHKGTPLKLIQYHDAMLKTDLYITKIKQRSGNNFFVPRNYGKEYENQLTDEYLGKKKNERGYEEDIWLSKDDNNHLGDCEKKQLIIPSLLGPLGLKALADKIAKPVA